MRAALDASPDVALYREYVVAVGLAYSVRTHRRLRLPAFAGSLDLRFAHTTDQPTGPARPGVSPAPAPSGPASTGSSR
jgi:hypothetical protein